MNYFFDCVTKEEAKIKYRKLAKEFHPDKGGKESDMKELQKQYDDFSEHDHKSTFRHPYGNASEQAFKDNIRNAFKTQNANTHYHKYTDNNETQRLRDENHMLRGNIYQLESNISSWKHKYENEVNARLFCEVKLEKLRNELNDLQMEYIKHKDNHQSPATRFEAIIHFIYFMIKGKQLEFKNEK